jgi:hypothetical protein
MKKFNFGEENPTKKSLIIVNQYISSLKLHAHKQSISQSDINHLKSLEHGIDILFDNRNPYKLTEEFALLSRARSGRYNPENIGSLQRLSGNYNFYYRLNKMFSIPQDFISLKFQIKKRQGDTPIKIQAQGLILT